ncbi:MAG TPA: hypothetical protein VFZ33_19345 [Chitinophagaceae bacterium]
MKSNTEMARTAFRYCGGIAALFILFTGRLQAQQTKTEEKPVMQVSYQDDDNKYLVFKVAVTNAGSKKTILKVSDKNEILYSESFTSDLYTKKIKLPKNEFSSGSVEFRLTNGKDVIRKSFEVRHMIKEVLEISVTELK